MKYKIIYDYGLEGWSFGDEEFETVDEAVKKAILNNRGVPVPFLIVKIVDWEARELQN